ncbi:M23 family metallopeptidase [Streptomyces lydicus]|uniref:Peptidase n=1 Tax=Streptomyces lydicus TaxID=47763 RepID=A0A1D7VE82_9ACTN|nr:M23 family metallopeptidase [Streptomyces lydicus]AOP45066.1 peptidase [Streptomyces lydicus]
MASNKPAPEAPSAYELDDRGAFAGPAYAGGDAEFDGDGPWEEWDPTEGSVRPVRGKHRVAKQRGGGLARSGTVLGVGVIAAVGAGGMASAEDRPPVPISMPDVGGMVHDLADSLPDAASLPAVGGLISDSGSPSATSAHAATSADSTPSAADEAGPLSRTTARTDASGTGDGAGEALRSRILQQADAQQDAAEEEAREAAEGAAVKQAAADAAAARKTAEQAETAKKAAEQEAKRKAEEAARQKAEAARLAELAKSFLAPVSSYTLTASFGQAGDRWAADHTGQDFAAPTGTPVKAVHSGTITQAGWAGSYGYRIVLTLDDGTELWFCHLSSMVKTSGKVSTGDVIGRVGATGNVTGPHLHLEVRPDAGSPIDPMPWLRDHGVNV